MIRRPPRSTLSLHDALPISNSAPLRSWGAFFVRNWPTLSILAAAPSCLGIRVRGEQLAVRPVHNVEKDRKSTRLNSSHGYISYAVFCLKKQNLPPRTLPTSP